MFYIGLLKMLKTAGLKKVLYIVMCIFALSSSSMAEEWKYDLKNAYISRKVGENKYEVVFNTAILDYYMEKIGPHAGLYPPVFKDKEERKFIEAQLKALIGFLEIATNAKVKPELLWRYGWALAMGHNLDFPGSAKKAIQTFDKVLSIDPEHVSATYLYGVFLSTTQLKDKSILYLEKSIKNGIKEAKRYLVPVYLADESTRARGMKLLEEYVHDFPEDEQCKHLLKALKSGNVKIENVYK
jgi:tetratricopeptide (TPR) repeat protein